QRFRGAAQGLVARVGPHRAGTDEADADLRDQPGQLGDPRRDVRRPLSRDVAAARRAGAPARAAVEDDAAMTRAGTTTDTVLEVTDLRVLRGARTILSGVRLQVSRGEIVAVMGPSGSGKTTILRAVAGLERFQSGAIDVDGVT